MAHLDDVTLPDTIRFGGVSIPMQGSKPTHLPSGKRKVVLLWDQTLDLLQTSYRLKQVEQDALRQIWDVVTTVHSFRVRNWRRWNTGLHQSSYAGVIILPTDQPLQNTTDNSFVGDGSTTTFQAVSVSTAGATTQVKTILKLRAGALAAVNEVEVFDPADFTVNLNTGIFTFAVAPPNSETVKWGGVYDIAGYFVADDAFQEQMLAGHLVDVSGLQIMEENLA